MANSVKKYIENIISRNLIDSIDDLHNEKYNDISFSFDSNVFSEYHIYLNRKSGIGNRLKLSKNFYIYYSDKEKAELCKLKQNVILELCRMFTS